MSQFLELSDKEWEFPKDTMPITWTNVQKHLLSILYIVIWLKCLHMVMMIIIIFNNYKLFEHACALVAFIIILLSHDVPLKISESWSKKDISIQ